MCLIRKPKGVGTNGPCMCNARKLRLKLTFQDTRIKELEGEKAALIKKWFVKGQMSIKRKNKSGCCCIINDHDEIESMCALHAESELKALEGK